MPLSTLNICLIITNIFSFEYNDSKNKTISNKLFFYFNLLFGIMPRLGVPLFEKSHIA